MDEMHIVASKRIIKAVKRGYWNFGLQRVGILSPSKEYPRTLQRIWVPEVKGQSFDEDERWVWTLFLRDEGTYKTRLMRILPHMAESPRRKRQREEEAHQFMQAWQSLVFGMRDINVSKIRK